MLVAVVMTAVAAFHVFAAVSHLGLFYTLGRKDEHVSFAALSMTWAISAVGASWQLQAFSPGDALSGQRVELLGISLTVLAMDRVLRSVDRMGRRRVLMPVWVWGGVVANLGGLFADASGAGATLTLLGATYAVASALGCIPALRDVVGHTMRPTPKRFLIAGLVLWALALSVDFGLRALGRQPAFFYEWATVLTSLPLLYALIDRFGRTHEQLGQRSRELRLSYDELTDVRESLVQKQQLAAIGELSAVIAHDIRNPLAVLRNATSALRRTSLAPDDAQTLLGILDAETGRLNQLIDELLVFSKPNKPQLVTLSLTEQLEHAAKMPLDAKVPRRFQLDSPPGLTLRADRSMLEKTLGTMLQAAHAAAAPERELQFRVREEIAAGRPSIAITLTDRKESATELGSAMTPGKSGRASLGLAIAERVVQAHGGELRIANHPDGGPHICLVLPKAGPAA